MENNKMVASLNTKVEVGKSGVIKTEVSDEGRVKQNPFSSSKLIDPSKNGNSHKNLTVENLSTWLDEIQKYLVTTEKTLAKM
jgi:hypothetical protein